MTMNPRDWLSSPWHAGKKWLYNAVSQRRMPIRTLALRHRARILDHLLKLDDRDRYLRFGYAASDEMVARYVEQLNFDNDTVFGIFNRRLELIAMAHLAATNLPQHGNCFEFGVSVLENARGLGLGARLFARSVKRARNKGVDMMFIHALSENTAMLKIARNAGACVQRDGPETEAYLYLSAADLDTRVTELVENQLAEVDYQFKKQSRQLLTLLSGSPAIRKNQN